MKKEVKIGVIGLGYVGLPLAVEFFKKFKVVGYDINKERVNQLQNGIDNTLETDINDLKSLIKESIKPDSISGLFITYEIKYLSDCNFYIVTVPTPVDKYKKPVLTPFDKSLRVGWKSIKKG